jgi:hypothetical protein
MNIFFLHLNPKICAMYHVDKHVVKMILETTQILCSVHILTSSEYKPPYKLTHKNHPCNIWARKSLSNYIWLVNFGKALCDEYTYRYNKIHKCQSILYELEKNFPNIEDIGFTDIALAMPDMYKGDDPIICYRTYYYFEKYHIHSWKKRSIPEWIKDFEI